VWSFQLVQIPALACVKLSFIFFYRRIFCTGVGNIFRIITTIAIIFITAWAVTFEFAFLFICRGHFAAWWVSIQSLDTYCHPELDLELGFSTTDFITDAIVILLPLPLVRSRPSTSLICLLIGPTDMQTSNARQSQTCCYRNIQSWGIVSSTDGQAGTKIDSPQRRTVATSITRMVIFIRAVQGLKVAYATSGANDRKYSWFVKVIFC